MGKRRIEKITKILNNNQRKVTFCKRKKGLLKKAIELSVLCDVSMFLMVYDKTQRRCVHYASDSKEDLVGLFNKQCHREFYTNKDYIKVGGRKEDFDQSEEEEESNLSPML